MGVDWTDLALDSNKCHDAVTTAIHSPVARVLCGIFSNSWEASHKLLPSVACLSDRNREATITTRFWPTGSCVAIGGVRTYRVI